MSILQSILLGAVQGLGEFLPISSSAHLILVPWLFKFPDPGLGFDVALHVGTLLAVLVYFRRDVWHLMVGFLRTFKKSTRDLENNIYQKLSWLIIIATIPGAIFGKLLEKQVENSFRNPLLIAGTMAIFGVLLYIADTSGKKEKNLNHLGWKQALIIGLAQSVALIPGVSRSGATMIAALFLAYKRPDAARFSFLLSMPIIFGAALGEYDSFIKGISHLDFWLGILSAAVFGFLAIKYLLKYISTNNFKVFVWYRLALAAVVLLIYFTRN